MTVRRLRLTDTTYRYRSGGEADTDRLAAEIAVFLGPGSVVALDGDLGAGKTRFSQGMAKALGVAGIVNSPTFTIIKEYEGNELPFYHMDVYRISAEEAGELGLEEYFDGAGVTLVEWASRIAALLPDEHLAIYIAANASGDREFTLAPHGEPYEHACKTMKENGLLQ